MSGNKTGTISLVYSTYFLVKMWLNIKIVKISAYTASKRNLHSSQVFPLSD